MMTQGFIGTDAPVVTLKVMLSGRNVRLSVLDSLIVHQI